jgi:hypothetical protein
VPVTSRVRAAARAHAATWRELLRWILRRPRRHAGEPFSYVRALTPVLSVFIGLSVVEIVVVDVVLPWAWLRAVGLVAGVYGLLWMLGMLAALRLSPHTVDDEGLHLRSGVAATLRVPWEVIATVGSRTQAVEGMRTVQVDDGAEPAVSLPVAGQTNVEVALARPVRLLADRGDERGVTAVRLFADDPRRLVARLRNGRADGPPATTGEKAR